MADTSTDGRDHMIVVNSEEQFSVWPADRELPSGWRPQGFTGSREACLSRVEEIWSDMRPLSLRQRLGQKATP